MNNVCLIGRLTKDPELRVTNNGLNTVSFSVAVQRDYKNAEGGYDADFINCVAWRQQAEFICKYFKKGSQIGIAGKLQTRSWDSGDGQKRFATEVVVTGVSFCEKSENNRQTQSYVPQEPQQAAPQQQDMFSDFIEADVNEDDLPFRGVIWKY